VRRIEAHGIGPDGARARVRGSVSSLAAQLARWGGATVIGTVRGEAEARQVSPGAADHVVSLHSGPIPAMRQVAPAGVDRIIEVALSAKADLDAAIVRNGAVLAAYASPKDQPELPFRPMLFANVTMRLLGSDDFPLRAKDAAARPHPCRCAIRPIDHHRRDCAARADSQIPGTHRIGPASGRVLVSLP